VVPASDFDPGPSRRAETGRLQFPNGDCYEGDLRNGKMQGNGVLYNTHQRYEGRFQNGMRHGQGTLETLHSKFVGSWNYNKMQGSGTLVDSVGWYEGSFAAGFREGEGTQRYRDGRVYRGTFKNNLLVKGELQLPDSTRLEGEWKNDTLFSGVGTIVYPNGDTYQGEWRQCLPHRFGKLIYR